MTIWEYHMKNCNFLAGAIASVVLAFAPQAGMAQKDDAPPPILFTNVNVFDGFNPNLIMNANVLVEGNVITQVSTDPIEIDGAFEVDGTGKTMTPRLDRHAPARHAEPSRGHSRISDAMGRGIRRRDRTASSCKQHSDEGYYLC